MSDSEHIQRLRVIQLEDDAQDRFLIERAMRNEGFDCEFVPAATEDQFREALDKAVPDLILSDFTVPGFDGGIALLIANSVYPEVPFIFVSGTIGEERAVEALKSGATDYILKDHLQRLGAAVRRALREARERTERKKAEAALRASEERFRELAETIQEVFWVTDPAKNLMLYISPAYENIWGRSCQSLYNEPRSWIEAIHPEDRERVLQAALTRQAEGAY
ncbi:MAG: response regulator, partial [Limisphaerales bacterium]